MAEQTKATTHALLIKRMKRQTADKNFKGNGWGARHVLAWHKGGPLVKMIEAAAEYADAHRARFDSGIGEDSFLGPEWESIIRACLALLNGDIGGLDGRTVDSLLREMLKLEGFNWDE